MQHRIARINLDTFGRLPAAIAQARAPHIAPDGVTLLGGQCPELNHNCVEQGEHVDHRGPSTAVPAPRGLGSTAVIDAQLARWADYDEHAEPIIAVGWGGEAAELNPDEALALAADLETFALRLGILARHLQRTQQHRNQA
ncbi:hypothetical protein BX265_2348 [Streptomyces sp. TLI_235]|nr:hypothetical protein [Streptomyces sp. TLI_235]PBC77597.1 hypothetical protein BX265_2348 [Streptomyces sp. TLI_235]